MPINKIRFQETTGLNLYALIRNKDALICYPAGEVFEAYGTSSRDASDYAIALTEQSIGFYTGIWPTFIERGDYDVVIHLRAGSTPADDDYNVSHVIERYWTGTAIAITPEANELEVCNRALAKMGGAKDNTYPIALVGDGEGGTSDNCNRLITPIRKEILKRIRPQECTYYAEFEESSFSGDKGHWEYVFDFPDNCLMVTRMIDESNHKKEYRYKIMQGHLFANTYSNDDGDAAFCEYIKNETDWAAFSDEVVEAGVTKLAAELAPLEIGGDWAWKRRQGLLEEYETLCIPKAKGINQSQQYNDETEDTTKYSFLGGRS